MRITLAARFLAVLLLAGLAACSHSEEQSLAPPSNFAVQQDPAAFDHLVFAWTRPSGEISGYEGQGRIGSGAWEDLGTTIPPDAVGGIVSIDSSVPELIDLAFRIRTVRGSLRSEWSNEAHLSRGIRWPVDITSLPLPQGMQLQWKSASTVATGVRVSRQVGSQWQVLADLPATATSYLDTLPFVADEPVRYRLSATLGSRESQPGAYLSPGFPPTAVWGLTATTETVGVRLRWFNPPIADQTFAICRCGLMSLLCCPPPLTPTPLPSQTREYLDPAPPGVYRYEVQSRYSNPASISPSAAVEGLANPTGRPTLAGTLVLLPQANAIARDSNGRFAFAHGGMQYPPATSPQRIVFRGAGAPPDRDLGVASTMVPPSVLFDAQEHPHLMLLRPVAGDPPVALVHSWYDGATWKEEEVVRRAFDEPANVRFARDGSGGLYAAWVSSSAGVAEYARRGATGWTIEDLVPVAGLCTSMMGLEVDPSGVPSVLASCPSGVLLLRRESVWTTESVPGGAGGTLHPTTAGLAVLQPRCDSVTLKEEVLVQERTAAGWGEENLVEEYPVCLPPDFQGLRDSPDGARRLVWLGFGWLDLRFREGNGAWTTVKTGLENAPFVWFGPSNKLALLVKVGGLSLLPAEETVYAQYLEP